MTVADPEAPGDEDPDGIDHEAVRPAEARERFERRVQRIVEAERAKREAHDRLAAEVRGPLVPPPFETLRDLLARPRLATVFRVEGLQPVGSRTILSAPAKAGKTTLIGNYVRSVADGILFLGRYAVAPVEGAIALVDFEMSAPQLRAWLCVQAIRHDDRVWVLAMRGCAAAFNILDPQVRAHWVQALKSHQVAVLIIDCLRPVLDALGLDEHREVGTFLVALDALLAEAEIGECLIVHHMGHTNERARGDSRLRDWPDVEWSLVRQTDDPTSARFIKAYGRDVDVPESRLLYDPVTRALTVTDGSRKEAAAQKALAAVVGVLTAATEVLTGQAVKRALLGDHPRDAVDLALRLGVKTHVLALSAGPRNAKLYGLAKEAAVADGALGSLPSFRASGNLRQASPETGPTAPNEFPDDYRESEARRVSQRKRKRPDGNGRSPTPSALPNSGVTPRRRTQRSPRNGRVGSDGPRAKDSVKGAAVRDEDETLDQAEIPLRPRRVAGRRR